MLYKATMNDTIRNRLSDKNWLFYARFELPAEEMSGNGVDSWLTDVFSPLHLPPDFTLKVIDSVHNTSVCLPAEVRKVRLLVFTAAIHPGYGQTWGFFYIVKDEEVREDPKVLAHEIVIYLYREGEPGSDRAKSISS